MYYKDTCINIDGQPNPSYPLVPFSTLDTPIEYLPVLVVVL